MKRVRKILAILMGLSMLAGCSSMPPSAQPPTPIVHQSESETISQPVDVYKRQVKIVPSIYRNIPSKTKLHPSGQMKIEAMLPNTASIMLMIKKRDRVEAVYVFSSSSSAF